MDKDLMLNSHLLPLNIDENDINQKSDSDICSISSDIEVDEVEQVNEDFIRRNLTNNEHSSEDELEYSTNFDNNEEIICLSELSTSSTSKTLVVANQHKRRQWSFEEKLEIISEFNRSTSLHQLEVAKEKKRKRIGGVGAKLAYYDLDEHLIKWYRSKRGLDQEGINVCKDKVTFKGMIRQEKTIVLKPKAKNHL
ncbi:unnamed protein product [Rotaria socialis]|uniref:Uncharacterized protein n=1 Tax=Rotaria socialis TaxID=392032 RepID=A0A821DA36_9BILA|nr:unnamed protein product [Rotaria socialis]CAF3440900.1 unnamed protein product [Rotaria socialis]CAF4506147.1 unnamed protein product [Rotaria socialis]CAF4617568.1 unnamed protein product [Rotaria socialis]